MGGSRVVCTIVYSDLAAANDDDCDSLRRNTDYARRVCVFGGREQTWILCIYAVHTTWQTR